MVRVIVTGASGLLGRALMTELQSEPSVSVLGLAFSRVKHGLEKVDITRQEEVQAVIEKFKPNVIVHAAAERRPDIVEGQEKQTHNLNVEATRTLCQQAAAVNAYVIYISTDYVFDGKNPPYQVDATPNPLNKYGLSKLEGEKVTMHTSSNNIVFRVPILYGPLEHLEESAVTLWFPNVKDTSKEHHMNDTQHRFPTYTPDVAKAIKQLVLKRVQDPSLCGYYHFSGNEDLTRYKMTVAMGEACGLPTNHIIQDTTPPSGASRPHNSYLSSERLESIVQCHRTPFKEAVKECLNPFL